MDGNFTQTMNNEEKAIMQSGLDITLNHLEQAFNNKNINKNKNNNYSLTLPNTPQIFNNNNNNNQNELEWNFNVSNINKKDGNENIEDNMIKQMNENTKLIRKMNENLVKLPTMTISNELKDVELKLYYKEYKNIKHEIFEFEKITYKTKLYISAEFIPRNERIKIELNKRNIQKQTQFNYKYIENTLNAAVTMSKSNYFDKLNEKENQLKQKRKIKNIITNRMNEKMAEKAKKLNMNELKFKSQIIKSALYNNYNAEINKLHLMKIEMDEYYKNELEKYKNKTILSFEKLAIKINLEINSNDKINYDFQDDLEKAHKQKEENKTKMYLNQYKIKDENKLENDKYVFIDGIKMHQNQYKPNQMIFKQLNYVNIQYKDRKIIINNFGNMHDKYNLKLIENKFKQNDYNQNRKYYKNYKYRNYNYKSYKNNQKYKKYQKYQNYQNYQNQDFY